MSTVPVLRPTGGARAPQGQSWPVSRGNTAGQTAQPDTRTPARPCLLPDGSSGLQRGLSQVSHSRGRSSWVHSGECRGARWGGGGLLSGSTPVFRAHFLSGNERPRKLPGCRRARSAHPGLTPAS